MNTFRPGYVGFKARLMDAFADVKQPGDEFLACRGWGYDAETAEELVRMLHGRHWKDLLGQGEEWFRSNHDILQRLTPEAYIFYLPAFLLEVVEIGEALDLLPEWIVYSLELPDQRWPEIVQWHNEMKKKLTPARRAVVLEFLDHLEWEFDIPPQLSNHIKSAREALQLAPGAFE